MKSLNELAKEAYETAVSKGWHNDPCELGTALALIHTEITEAYEAYAASLKSPNSHDAHIAEELADVLIRTFDTAGKMNLDLDKHALDTVGVNTLEEMYLNGEWVIKSKNMEKFLLQLHMKVSAIMEDYRRVPDEELDNQLAKGMAQVILFVISYSKNAGLNVVEAVKEKMEKNTQRPHRHGNKRA